MTRTSLNAREEAFRKLAEIIHVVDVAVVFLLIIAMSFVVNGFLALAGFWYWGFG